LPSYVLRLRLFIWLRDQVDASKRRQLEGTAVVMFDVDHFKLINDTFGHAAGNRCSRRLPKCAAVVGHNEHRHCRWAAYRHHHQRDGLALLTPKT
jgi:diguanylate cyclase (GGDEF)-like protein